METMKGVKMDTPVWARHLPETNLYNKLADMVPCVFRISPLNSSSFTPS
jgi:hypothetical protein